MTAPVCAAAAIDSGTETRCGCEAATSQETGA